MKLTHRFVWTGILLVLSAAGQAQVPDAIDGQAFPSLAPLVKAASPAVVNIRVSQTIETSSPYSDEMFRRFFGLPDQPGRSREIASAGSGVIVDAVNGYILTNHHVVANADEIEVFLFNEDSIDAEVVGSDAETDIAVLKVAPDNLVDIPIGNSDDLQVGDFVIAIGNPFGLGHTVTSGIVSALGRSGISRDGLEDFIQTDASINPGNSGGALVNMRGELVGINSAILSRTGGNIGIGFAVPSAIAHSIMRQIVEYGEVRRGLLGVTIDTIDAESAQVLGAEVNRGALVTNVEAGSAAEQAGLRVDDIIVRVDERTISDGRALATAIGLKGSGEGVDIEFIRDGRRRTVRATLGERSLRQIGGVDIHPGLSGSRFATETTTGTGGIEVADVEPGSPAAQRGLLPGDIIIAVNREPIGNLEQLQEIAGRNRILFLLVRRGDRQLLLQIR